MTVTCFLSEDDVRCIDGNVEMRTKGFSKLSGEGAARARLPVVCYCSGGNINQSPMASLIDACYSVEATSFNGDQIPSIQRPACPSTSFDLQIGPEHEEKSVKLNLGQGASH